MSEPKAQFLSFITELGVPDPLALLARFEHYHALLCEQNQNVNLVSRATPVEEYWTRHYLDSLLALKCIDIDGKYILDLGSGGGLPGIPLHLAVPNTFFTLLEGVGKKAGVLRYFAEELGMQSCFPVWFRLEEFYHRSPLEKYDYVVCRAVRMEDRYRTPLIRLLKPDGMVVFYKARAISDLEGYQKELLYSEKLDYGYRCFYGIRRQHLKPKKRNR